jgi:coenzyme F420-dependent glucose-6-phosphate dehydrogenase
MPAYYLACATEQFTPSDLLEQAVEGEKAYFDGICCTDAWAWLGAVGRATEHVRLGNAVTSGIHGDDVALVAQAFATLESLFPSRAFLGVGAPGQDLARLEGTLELIGRRLADMLPRRRPPVYVSAFDEGAAHVAGRLGDGLWTRAEPELAPTLIEAYHEGSAEMGRDAGEILLQASFSLGLESADVRSALLVDDDSTEALHGPEGMQRQAQATVTDDSSLLVSPEPDEHVERIREIEQLGATAVVLRNLSSDPLEAIRVYGRDVLPKLRG